jgi:hypothetical protein
VFFRGSEEAEKCDGTDMGSDSASVNDRDNNKSVIDDLYFLRL